MLGPGRHAGSGWTGDQRFRAPERAAPGPAEGPGARKAAWRRHVPHAAMRRSGTPLGHGASPTPALDDARRRLRGVSGASPEGGPSIVNCQDRRRDRSARSPWSHWPAHAESSRADRALPASRRRAAPATMNPMTEPHPSAAAFRAARDLLLRHREDYAAAKREFSWPALEEFNWALDWFDVIAAEHPGPARAADRRRRRRCRPAQLRRAGRPVQPGRQLAERARGPPRRPAAADAGQHRAAVGGHPGGDEAGRGHHPGQHAARPGRPRRPDRARRRPARGDRGRPRRQVRRPGRPLDRDRGGPGPGAARPRTAGSRTRTRPTSQPASPRTASPGPPTRCCCTSPPARPPSRSWSSTPTRPTRPGTCPRCTGSACSPGTCT